jgi:hypothetical protein
MRFRRILSAWVLAVLALAMGASGALAQSQNLYWERYDVDLVVQSNGDLRVTETQRINFTSGTFSEGFAQLLTTNTDGIDEVTVSEDGRLYTEVRSTFDVGVGEFAVDPAEGGALDVVWGMGRTRNETRTFELAYTVHGAIRRYDQGNELQWNALSPGLRDFPVEAARVTISVPPDVSLTYVDYIVEQGFGTSPMNVTVADDGRSAVAETTETIGPDEGIQVVAQLAGPLGGSAPSWQAAFDQRNAYEQNVKPLVDIAALVGGLLALFGGPALLYLLWYVRGRDPKIDAVPEHITAPPEGLRPGMAGAIVDERADVRDVIATIMDLAQRGFLAIEEGQAEQGAFRLGGREFTLHNTAEGKNLGELNAFERELYNALFAGRKSIRFRDLNQRFYANMTRLQQVLYQTVHREGYFVSSPEATRSGYGCLGGGLLVLVLGGGFLAIGALAGFTSYAICPFIGLAGAAAGLVWLGQHMPAKTRKGAEAAALTKAFKQYLGNLEKYADPAAVKNQFEKYLPWAIAFGLERTWISRFQRVPDTPMPGWYFPPSRPFGTYGYPYGTGTTAGGRGEARPTMGGQGAPAELPTLGDVSAGLSGGLAGMSEGLSSMLNSAGRVMTSTPPSSSTSRGGRSFSGGGGFRGGGGGFRSGGGSGGGGRGFR